ncbi:MAG: Gx transporter family protein [Zhaonellaceae bacterium]|jgi:heptaprenyl diphosphate synthase|nr:Gx transporter family protein [Clostridia bacterium]
MKLQGNVRKQVLLGILVSTALVLYLIEAMLPNPFPLPGVKLGLANIVNLLTLAHFGLGEGLFVAVIRVLLGSLIGGTFTGPAFIISFVASLLSTLAMYFFLRLEKVFSLISVSIVGAITHNLAQLLVVSILIGTFNIYYYLPFLLILALPVGISTGYMAQLVKKYLENFQGSKSD